MLVWVDNAQPSSTRTEIGHASHPCCGARAVLPPSIVLPGSLCARSGRLASWQRGPHRTNPSSRIFRRAVCGFVLAGPCNDRLVSFDSSGLSEPKKESKSRQSCGHGLEPRAALMRG